MARADHRAQALIYAHLFGLQEAWQTAEVRVVYLPLYTKQEIIVSEHWTREALSEWFEQQLNDYCAWLRQLVEWHKLRNEHLATLAFPFDQLRAGQAELIAASRKAIERQQRLYAEAPTGIGEPGTPPAAPALANAIARAGHSVANLPMINDGVEFA